MLFRFDDGKGRVRCNARTYVSSLNHVEVSTIRPESLEYEMQTTWVKHRLARTTCAELWLGSWKEANIPGMISPRNLSFPLGRVEE